MNVLIEIIIFLIIYSHDTMDYELSLMHQESAIYFRLFRRD